MDQTQLQQKIAEYYTKLPKEAQEVFSSMQWLETLKQISKKYGLSDQQIETVGTETTLVLLGIIHLDEYENILKNELNLPKESLDKMSAEIDESILKTIRPQLEETFDKNNKEEKEKLDERFNNLSKEIKDAIEKSDYQTKIYEIGQKYNLTVYQMGILGERTIDTMLGTILPNKFEESLKELQMPAEKITEIVNDTNEQIFKIIREELMKNINRNKTPENNFEPREELLKKIENPNLLTEKELPAPATPSTPSILSQKLSGAFQIPKTETEHTINNITKVPEDGKKVDPYRELPE